MNYNNIYILGDSLSDTGALVGAIGGILDRKVSFPVPFFNGRSFSNGPVAVEILANKLQLPLKAAWSCRNFLGSTEQVGNNYAVSNARASKGTLAIYELFFNQFQLKNQLSTLLNQHQLDENDLVVVLIGSNDIFGILSGEPEEKIEESVDEIQSVLNTLVNNKIKNIILGGVPNIGIIPISRNLSIQEFAENLSNNFNQALKAMKDKFLKEYPTAKISFFDTKTEFSNIINALSKKGYDSIHACLSDIADHQSISDVLDFLLKGQIGEATYNTGCSKEKICKYVFFDYFHPTRVVHEMAGRLLYSLISGEDKTKLLTEELSLVD